VADGSTLVGDILIECDQEFFGDNKGDTGLIGPLARFVDIDNYVHLRVGREQADIVVRRAGAFTVDSVTYADLGDLYRLNAGLRVTGNFVEGLIDGSVIISGTYSGISASGNIGIRTRRPDPYGNVINSFSYTPL
jgi:hypothetical protein